MIVSIWVLPTQPPTHLAIKGLVSGPAMIMARSSIPSERPCAWFLFREIEVQIKHHIHIQHVLLQHPMIKQFFCNTSLTGCISIDVSLVRRDTTILLNAFSYRRKVRSRLPSRLFLPAPLLRASARARQKEMGQRIASLCEYELRPVLHL